MDQFKPVTLLAVHNVGAGRSEWHLWAGAACNTSRNNSAPAMEQHLGVDAVRVTRCFPSQVLLGPANTTKHVFIKRSHQASWRMKWQRVVVFTHGRASADYSCRTKVPAASGVLQPVSSVEFVYTSAVQKEKLIMGLSLLWYFLITRAASWRGIWVLLCEWEEIYDKN